MKQKKLSALVGSICLILVLAALPFMAACPAPPAEEEEAPPAEEEEAPPPPFPELLTMGTGVAGGGFHMLTMGLAKVWKDEFGVDLALKPGVVFDNLVLFGENRFELLMNASIFMWAAWHGKEDLGFPKPIKNQRVMLNIYPNPYYILALKDSGMTKITDLKGKRVGCGPKATVWDKLIGPKFEAEGVKYFGDNPDIQKTFTPFGDMCEMVGDGTLDACVAMVEGLTPQPATLKLMEERELVALEWDPAVLEQFEGTFSPPAVIPKECLPFLEKDHQCGEGGISALIAQDTMDEDVIYALTKAVHENLEKLAKENPYWSYPVQFPEILTKDFGIPFHSGAIRYWEEVGLWKR